MILCQNKTISVLTATYNYGRFLPDCLRSVRNSILSPMDDWVVEHIVVDDGSDDGTEKLFRDKIGGVKYFRLPKNLGVAAARNLGIERACGKYILVLDADDVLLQRSLYYMVKSLIDSNYKWVYSDMLRVNSDLSYCIGDDYYGWEFDNCDDILRSILAGDHFIQHNAMFEKDLFTRVGGYDASLKMAEDLDLFIRFLLENEMPDYIPIISHLHRMHDCNVSRDCDKKGHMRDLAKLNNKYQEQLIRRNINT